VLRDEVKFYPENNTMQTLLQGKPRGQF
jgi:hypothetical protein